MAQKEHLSTMFKGYRTELDPNNIQRTNLRRNARAARFGYNFALARIKQAMDEKQKIPSAIDLDKEVTRLKRSEDFAWLYDCSRYSYGEGIRYCRNAVNRFFQERKKGNRKFGFPKFKPNGSRDGSFKLYGSIHVFDDCIQLPNIGTVRLKEHSYIPIGVKPINVTVRELNNRWYVSALIEIPAEPKKKMTKPM